MKYGSKIDNLLFLKEKGFNVPGFEIVSFEDVFADHERLQKLVDGIDINNKNALFETVRDFAKNNIKSTFGVRPDGEKFAVRSSCSIEDGDSDSFAGQFDTYLNVGSDELDKRIADCFFSLFNENVIDYIIEKKVALNDLRMNVIVQKMVSSDLSGIVFSANPQGLLNESVIVVGRGLGENVVSDRVDTTSYYYNLTDSVFYYEGKENLLERDTVEELIDVSKRISELLFEFSDVEFAIENGEIYVLQARKITTLDGSAPLIFDNSNIVESYPGISLPLTVSLVKNVYSGVFKGVTKRILKNKKELSKLTDVFSNMVGASNGRLYYKISNWYTLIKYMPLSKKLIPVWQEMLGVKNKTYDIEKTDVAFFTKAGVYFNTFRELFTVRKNMEKLNDRFAVIFKSFYDRIGKCESERMIVELYEEIENKIFSCWDITLINDVYTFAFTGLLKARLKKKYENYEQRANDYISGISNVESMKPVREMVELACEKKTLSSEEYKKKFDRYIHFFGDRNLEELKMESPTFRTCPELLARKIEEYSKDEARLASIRQSINSNANENFKGEDLLTRIAAEKCTLGIRNREVSRLNRSRLFGMARKMFLSLADIYEKQGNIDCAEDIYYLTVEEIKNAVNDKTCLKDIVEKRKEDYKLFNALPAYTRLVFEKKEFDKSHCAVNSERYYQNSDELHGIPCSTGIVTGEALVVENPSDANNVEDKILVTKMTDPGWVFLLVTAKGVISEKGSLLSHTAIISRELKKPAVVGVEGLLDTVRTGDMLELDAVSGTVKIVKRGT